MAEIKTVTRTYVDDEGNEHSVTGVDISEFPQPSEHAYYQEGSYLRCTCHPNTTKRMPAGASLVKEGSKYRFEKY